MTNGTMHLIIQLISMNTFIQMVKPLLLVVWALSLVACKAYLYTEVKNDTPQPCRITCGGYSYMLEPGRTMSWPSSPPDNDVPVQITQGAGNSLEVADCLAFREMAKGKRGRLWSTLYVIPYIRETLVLCHDEAGRLTWRKK